MASRTGPLRRPANTPVWLMMAGIVICLLAGIAIVITGVLAPQPSKPREFNAQVWRLSLKSPSDDSTRLAMLDDLLQRHHLVGMSRSELESLLGEPTQQFDEQHRVSTYFLGTKSRTFGFTLFFLVVEFDDTDQVSNVRIVED